MRVLTAAEAADELKVSDRTVNRLVAAGLLAASNIGSPRRPRLRITDEAIAAYVEHRSLSPVPTRGVR